MLISFRAGPFADEARERGIDMESAPLEKLDELWDEAKAESRK